MRVPLAAMEVVAIVASLPPARSPLVTAALAHPVAADEHIAVMAPLVMIPGPDVSPPLWARCLLHCGGRCTDDDLRCRRERRRAKRQPHCHETDFPFRHSEKT